MIEALISDFSRVLLFPKDMSYKGGLNRLHREASADPRYRLLDTFELNVELLEYYQSVKEKVRLCIFTTETIQDSPELAPKLRPIFEKIYSAEKNESDQTRIICVQRNY